MKWIIFHVLLLLTIDCFGDTSKVIKVIDGDTFETESGERVRLIGINAPEIADVFGEEASHYLSNLILNKTVDLQSDKISQDKDQYQRLLRYVYLDGVDINQKMIMDGFAFAYLKYNFSKLNDYKLAQIEARENNLGIWGDSNSDRIIIEQVEKASFWQSLSPRAYFIGLLVLILILIGLYSYLKI